MTTITISAEVEAAHWEELKALAEEDGRDVSGLLTEAIADFVQRHRVRPEVLSHVENSIRDNETLGRVLDQ